MGVGPCNWCQFNDMKRRAAAKGADVILRKGSIELNGRFPEGVDAYVVPRDEELQEGRDSDQWKAWFASLPDSCVC